MFGRYATAISSGTVMTLGLLYLMQSLIDWQPGAIGPERERGILNFLPDFEEKVVVIEEQQIVDREQLTTTTLPPPVSRTYTTDSTINVPSYGPGTPTPINDDFGLSSYGDGPLVALVRVAPSYPAKAAQRGLSGHVIVQFDVTANGLVTNASVVESSDSVFDKDALKAALRFKYRPRVVDGVAQETIGIRTVIRFELED